MDVPWGSSTTLRTTMTMLQGLCWASFMSTTPICPGAWEGNLGSESRFGTTLGLRRLP